MKVLLIFLLVTTAVIIGSDYFFEYCVSREVNYTVMCVVSIFITIAWILYLRYLVRLIIKLLKLK